MNFSDHKTGIEVVDAKDDEAFLSRPVDERLASLHLSVLQRLVQVFVLTPDRVLQELADVAISLCGADSAGVSLETVDAHGNPVFHWVATSGEYAQYLNAMLPRLWMPCIVCLDRMRPQIVRVPKAHFDAMGIDAEPITDGILVPWQVQGVRGTIWVLAHGRTEAFTQGDLLLMETFASLATAAVRNQEQHKSILRERTAQAAAATANDLAHTATALAERKLLQSHEEFETGMEAACLGMWHFDPKTGIVTADERMHRIFGSPEPNGVVDYWLDLLHPEDRDRVGEHFAGVLAGKHDYDIEYRILRKGEVRWVRSKGKAVGDKSNPEQLYAVIEDITKRKQAEAALQQNEKLAAVGRLASTIAHEINNPLESVTNLLYLIQNSDDVAEIHAYVDTAERELRRVSLIANQTLRFHRQTTEAAAAYCYDLIGETLAMYQGRIVNNKITVEKKKRAENPVTCMAGEIRQVLSNLMVNAIDAMPSGGRLILRSRETTNQRSGRKGLMLTVADTGLGMSSVVKQKVFEAFYTTKGIGGTGLGLWISKEIVERHGGTLRFRSCDTPGRSGTVFNLFLPHTAN